MGYFFRIIIWFSYLGIITKIDHKYTYLILAFLDTIIGIILDLISHDYGENSSLYNLFFLIFFVTIVFIKNTVYFYLLQKSVGTFWFYLIFLFGFLFI